MGLLHQAASHKIVTLCIVSRGHLYLLTLSLPLSSLRLLALLGGRRVRGRARLAACCRALPSTNRRQSSAQKRSVGRGEEQRARQPQAESGRRPLAGDVAGPRPRPRPTGSPAPASPLTRFVSFQSLSGLCVFRTSRSRVSTVADFKVLPESLPPFILHQEKKGKLAPTTSNSSLKIKLLDAFSPVQSPPSTDIIINIISDET